MKKLLSLIPRPAQLEDFLVIQEAEEICREAEGLRAKLVEIIDMDEVNPQEQMIATLKKEFSRGSRHIILGARPNIPVSPEMMERLNHTMPPMLNEPKRLHIPAPEYNPPGYKNDRNVRRNNRKSKW